MTRINNEFNPITVLELDKVNVSEEQLIIIKTIRRKVLFDNFLFILFPCIVADIFFVALTDSGLGLLGFIILAIAVGVCSIFIISGIKHIISMSRNIYEKAEYGFIEHKYRNVSKTNGGNTTYYYFNVNFPEKKVFIEDVRCSKNIFSNSNIDDKILVVSFYKNDIRAVPLADKEMLNI